MAVSLTGRKINYFLAAVHVVLVTIGALYCTCPVAEQSEAQHEQHDSHSDGHFPDMHQLHVIVLQAPNFETSSPELHVLQRDITEPLFQSSVPSLRFLSFFCFGLDPPPRCEHLPSFGVVRAPPLA